MKGQIPAFLVAVCVASLVPTVVPTAQATATIRECSASPGKTQGHWSWRLIDGRKCWYAGKTVIAKASLRWPAKTQVKDAQARAVEAKAGDAKAGDAKAADVKAVDVKPADAKAGNLTPSDLKAAQARPAPATAGFVNEKRGNPMDAQARMLDDDSFESRWRARVNTE